MAEIKVKQLLPNWWRVDRGKTYLGIVHCKDGFYRVVHQGDLIGEAQSLKEAVKILELVK